jgi:1-acyl-sn-glycerol-3-phosphate acyltransferase
MLFDIISKIRFGLSLIRLWFSMLGARSLKKKVDRDTYYGEVLRKAKIHINDLIRISKMNLIVDGLENIPDEPVVFMGNHQSYIDIYVAVGTLSRRLILIGKKEILKIPIIGKLGLEMNVLFLDRENPREGLKTILEAIRLIKEERFDVLIYPEGTRSKSREMGEFHKGSFKIAQKTKVPIVPMVVNDAYKVFEDTSKVTPGVDVYLKFLPPIYLDELSEEDAKNIDQVLKDVIQKELDRLNS